MKIEPQAFKQGEKKFVVLECVMRDVDFKPIDVTNPGGDQKRQHVLVATAATFIDEEYVKEALEAQRLRLEAAAEAESGQERIDGAKLDLDHFEGKHADALVKGCDECDKERELIDKEREADVEAIPITRGKAKAGQ